MSTNRNIPAVDNPYYSNVISSADVTVGAETGGNTRNVSIQLNGRNGPLAVSAGLYAYLSDNADGSTIAVTAPSGGWAIGTDGLLIPIVANKAAILVSEGDGDIDITIIEAATKTFYLVLITPDGGLKITAVPFA